MAPAKKHSIIKTYWTLIAPLMNKVFAAFLIIANVSIFMPWTFRIFSTNNKVCNMGVVLLPITVLINLLVIPATLTLINKTRNHNKFLIVNFLSASWTMYWLNLFLTAR